MKVENDDAQKFQTMSAKIEKMDAILKQDLFTNPIREAHQKLRQDLIDFQTIFNKNLSELENQYCNNLPPEPVKEEPKPVVLPQPESSILQTNLDKKIYQVEILKKEFALYESQVQSEIERLKTENAKQKYRIEILLNTISELEGKK